MQVAWYVGMGALRQLSPGAGQGGSYVRTAKLLGIPLGLLLLLLIGVLAHRLFMDYPREGIWIVALTAVFSLVLGRAYDFLNYSSLRTTYAARLTRTFLGASNSARVFGAPNDDNKDIQASQPNDDLPHDRYHPEAYGGPLHLINVCINETIEIRHEALINI